ncbi:MAG: hypothetical protein IBJ03_15915 [Gemmatimonadaceae bacterium]|nr:hypothetical protein [Gemmatimonadaceae bacterium]
MKWYYHPLYRSEAEAILEVAARTRIQDFNNDPDYGNGDRVLFYSGTQGKCCARLRPLEEVRDGDVLTVDGHGVGAPISDAANEPAGYIAKNRITTSQRRFSVSPNTIARRLKADGLQNRKILIKFYACLTAVNTSNGMSTACVLARALGFSNVVVQGYNGTTHHGDNGRHVNPTGYNNAIEPAHLHRKYYDSAGRELSEIGARKIAGPQVANKDREGHHPPRQAIRIIDI